MANPTNSTRALLALNRRLNAQAYELLCAEITRLDSERERLRAENEDLRKRLAWAEDCAERWRDDAIAALDELADATGGAPGLTQDGRLVICTPAADDGEKSAEAPAEAPTSDEATGMAWWNGLGEAERAQWLAAANTSVVAEAWAYFQRQPGAQA